MSRTAKIVVAVSLLLSVLLILAFVVAVVTPGRVGFAEKSKVDDLTTRVAALERRVGDLGGQVKALQGSVDNLQQFRGALCGQLVASGNPQLRSLAPSACGRRTAG